MEKFCYIFYGLAETHVCRYGDGCPFPCRCADGRCDPWTGGCDDGISCQSGPHDLTTLHPWGGVACQEGNVAYGKGGTNSRYYLDGKLDDYILRREYPVYVLVDLGVEHVVHSITVYTSSSSWHAGYLSLYYMREDKRKHHCDRYGSQYLPKPSKTFYRCAGIHTQILFERFYYSRGFYRNYQWLIGMKEVVITGFKKNDCSLCSEGAECTTIQGCTLCPAGWQVPECTAACTTSMYGENCAFTCDYCNYRECYPKDGGCIYGCLEPFVHGLSCTIDDLDLSDLEVIAQPTDTGMEVLWTDQSLSTSGFTYSIQYHIEPGPGGWAFAGSEPYVSGNFSHAFPVDDPNIVTHNAEVFTYLTLSSDDIDPNTALPSLSASFVNYCAAPTLRISCKENCGTDIFPMEVFTLEVSCHECGTFEGYNLTWESDNPVDWLYDTSTGQHDNTLSFYSGVLTDTNFRITLNMTRLLCPEFVWMAFYNASLYRPAEEPVYNYNFTSIPEEVEGSVVLLVVIIVPWIIFCSLSLWAWRRDKWEDKIEAIAENELALEGKHAYAVEIFTGRKRYAGTTSSVSLQINGSRQSVALKFKARTKWDKTFSKGNKKKTVIMVMESMGELKSVDVHLDCQGDNPAWFLDKIVIEDLQSKQLWLFRYQGWISAEEPDSLHQNIPVSASPEEHDESFLTKFCQGMKDGHTWISLQTKPSSSSFTRLQRAVCLFLLTMVLMAVNLTFKLYFEHPSENKSAINNINFSKDSLLLALRSAGMVILGYWTLLLAIRIAKRRPSPFQQTEIHKLQLSESSLKTMPLGCSESTTRATSMREVMFQVGEELESDMSSTVAQQDGSSHHSSNMILWLVLVGGILASSSWIALAGRALGAAEGVSLLLTTTIGILLDVGFAEPLMVLLLVLCRRLPVKEEVIPLDKLPKVISTKNSLIVLTTDLASCEYKKASPKAVNDAAQKMRNLRNARRTVFDIVMFCLYALVLMLIGNSMVHSDAYKITASIESLLVYPEDGVGFYNVTVQADLWEYLETTALPSLQSVTDRYISGATCAVVGKTRIRQLRIKKGECELLSPRIPIQRCWLEYSEEREDRGSYDKNWSVPLGFNNNSGSSAWVYQHTASSVIVGQNAMYPGGGYVQEVSTASTKNLELLKELKEANWFDEATRVVFFEMTAFSPHNNLFTSVNLLFEFHPVGTISPYSVIWTSKLYSLIEWDNFYQFMLQLVFVTMTLLYIYREWESYMSQTRHKYVSSIWTWMSFLIIFLSVGFAGVFWKRMIVITETLERYRASRASFTSFHAAGLWHQMTLSVIGVLLFLVILNFIKLLKFSPRIVILIGSMRLLLKPVLAMLVYLGVSFVVILNMALVTIGPSCPSFSSFHVGLMTLLSVVVTEFDYGPEECGQLTAIGRSLYIILITGAATFVWFWMLQSVVDYATIEMRKSLENLQDDFALISHFWEKFTSCCGLYRPSSAEDLGPHDRKVSGLSEEMTLPQKLDKLEHLFQSVVFDSEEEELYHQVLQELLILLAQTKAQKSLGRRSTILYDPSLVEFFEANSSLRQFLDARDSLMWFDLAQKDSVASETHQLQPSSYHSHQNNSRDTFLDLPASGKIGQESIFETSSQKVLNQHELQFYNCPSFQSQSKQAEDFTITNSLHLGAARSEEMSTPFFDPITDRSASSFRDMGVERLSASLPHSITDYKDPAQDSYSSLPGEKSLDPLTNQSASSLRNMGIEGSSMPLFEDLTQDRSDTLTRPLESASFSSLQAEQASLLSVSSLGNQAEDSFHDPHHS